MTRRQVAEAAIQAHRAARKDQWDQVRHLEEEAEVLREGLENEEAFLVQELKAAELEEASQLAPWKESDVFINGWPSFYRREPDFDTKGGRTNQSPAWLSRSFMGDGSPKTGWYWAIDYDVPPSSDDDPYTRRHVFLWEANSALEAKREADLLLLQAGWILLERGAK